MTAPTKAALEELDQDQGASLRDRAGGPADLSRCASQPKALIPSAEELASRLADPSFQRAQAVSRLAARLGFVFRMARIMRGLTVAELAAISGFSSATVKRFESGDFITAGLRMMGELSYHLEVELEFTILDRCDAQGIEAGTGETREAGLDPKDESPVGNADAPGGSDHAL